MPPSRQLCEPVNRLLTHYPRLTLHSLPTSQGGSIFSTWRGGAYTLPTSDTSLPAHQPGMVRFLNLEGGSYTLPSSDTSLPAHQPGMVRFSQPGGGGLTHYPCLTLHSLPTSQGGSVFSTSPGGGVLHITHV